MPKPTSLALAVLILLAAALPAGAQRREPPGSREAVQMSFSPIVKRAYTPSALSTAIPCSTTPMASPPTMFTTMMIMLAIDSPRTNRLAPSMLAKKSA